MEINLNKELVSKELLLKKVQDVDIYRFYTGEEVVLKTSIISPIRKEKSASFGYFQGKSGEICFKDFLLGAGDCIKFVELMFSLTYFEALSRIVIDFNLVDHFIYKDLGEPIKTLYNSDDYEKRETIIKRNNALKLGIKSREWEAHDLVYWYKYGIDIDTLTKYKVKPIKYIFINGNPLAAEKYAYAYIENKDGIETIKTYQPFSSNYKWMNNHDSSVWQGWSQLPEKGDELIITKSLKDVMSITSILNIPAVSLQAEGTNPKDNIIEELKSRFDKIYVLYDNDFDKKENWGQIFSKQLCDKYDFVNLCIPKEFQSKDFSDLVKNIESVEFPNLWDRDINVLSIMEKVRLIWDCSIYLPF